MTFLRKLDGSPIHLSPQPENIMTYIMILHVSSECYATFKCKLIKIWYVFTRVIFRVHKVLKFSFYFIENVCSFLLAVILR